MEINMEEFIALIEEEFDDIEAGVLKPESKFRESFEWNSINALIFIALVDTEYDVTITAEDIASAETLQDLFDIIKSKSE